MDPFCRAPPTECSGYRGTMIFLVATQVFECFRSGSFYAKINQSYGRCTYGRCTYRYCCTGHRSLSKTGSSARFSPQSIRTSDDEGFFLSLKLVVPRSVCSSDAPVLLRQILMYIHKYRPIPGRCMYLRFTEIACVDMVARERARVCLFYVRGSVCTVRTPRLRVRDDTR